MMISNGYTKFITKGGQISMWYEGVLNEGSNEGCSNSNRKRDMTPVYLSVKRRRKMQRKTLKCYRRSMGEARNSLLLRCVFGPEQLVLAFMMILIVLLIFLHSQSQAKKPRKQQSSSNTISEATFSIVHALSGSSSSKEKGKEPITPTKTASVSVRVSRGKSVELQMKIHNNFMKIRY